VTEPERCVVCGQRIVVESDREGTSHCRGVAEEEVRRLLVLMAWMHDLAWGSDVARALGIPGEGVHVLERQAAERGLAIVEEAERGRV